MIVKNEMKVLPRCFESIVKYLDYWNIHDTGSTDGTPEYIQKYFKEKGIPGKLYHTPWKNFGYNRSQAVKTSKGKADYTILFDADFTLVVRDENFKDKLTADAYLIKYEGGLDYRQTLLVKTKFDWRYIGVTHEYIHCPEVKNIQVLDYFTIHHLADGGCRGDKFERDIQLLKQGIEEEPDNQRYYFYLAQSYKDIGKFDEAIPYYQKRVDFGGWGEEVYYSLYQIGLCKLRRNDSLWEFMGDLLRAFFYRPQRLESLYHLIRYCRFNKMPLLGYQLGKMAINNDYPKDLLFIEKPIHDWLFLDEVALCAFMAGKFKKACALGRRILNEQKYQGEAEKSRLEKNMMYYKQAYEQWLRNDKSFKTPINIGGLSSAGATLQGNSLAGVAGPRSGQANLAQAPSSPQPANTQIDQVSEKQLAELATQATQGQAEDVTVVLYINQLRPTLEQQLGAVLQQTKKPTELWVAISNQVELTPQLTQTLQKFNKIFPNLKALKIKGDDYDGRLRVISQIKTKWIAMYDDNRLPNPQNLEYYLQLVQEKPELEKAILGQWGWRLHPAKRENGQIVSKWELFPDINQSQFLMTDQRGKGTGNDLIEVDYLCGHWFASRDNFYALAKAHDLKEIRLTRDAEDILFSFESRQKRDIKSYKCCPPNEEAGLTYNCGGMQDPINYEMLTQRSDLIKSYCLDGYEMVCGKEGSSPMIQNSGTVSENKQPQQAGPSKSLDDVILQAGGSTDKKVEDSSSTNLFALSSEPVTLNQLGTKSMVFQAPQSEQSSQSGLSQVSESCSKESTTVKKESEPSSKLDLKNIFALNGEPAQVLTSDRKFSTDQPKVHLISDTFHSGSVDKHEIEETKKGLVGNRDEKIERELTKYVDQRIAFFCPDYTSLGGSEFTIKTLYDRVKAEVEGQSGNSSGEVGGQVIITTNVVELLQFKPKLVITQQKAIGLAIQLCTQLKIPLWILTHGPGQYRANPQCEMVIYNSRHLMEFENPTGVKKMVYHPAIDLDRYRLTPEQRKGEEYITFVGSTRYNYLKGCDLFVELARAMPEQKFKYVGPVEEIDYDKNYFLVGQMPRLTPDHYDPKKLPENLEVVANTTEIEKIYAQTKVLVIPSLVESYGRVAVEGAVAGVPVVCSGLLGLKEATYGLSEYVEAYRKVGEFKKSLEKVLGDYEKYVERTKEIVEKYRVDEEKSFQELISNL